MLQKMGWKEGQGLGATQQASAITAPIKVRCIGWRQGHDTDGVRVLWRHGSEQKGASSTDAGTAEHRHG